MDIGSGSYYMVGPGGSFHTQIDCQSIRANEERQGAGQAQLVSIIKRGSEFHVVTPKGRVSVSPCLQCQASLEWGWQDQASCLGSGEDMITPRNEAKADELIATYCANCPVKVECAKFALNRSMIGIWGGEWVRQHGGRASFKAKRAMALDRLRAMVSVAQHTEDVA